MSGDTETLEEKLSRFLEFEKNWDGYGAEKIDPRCIERARRVLDMSQGTIWRVSAIVPCSNGGVEITMKARVLLVKFGEIKYEQGFSLEIALYPDHATSLWDLFDVLDEPVASGKLSASWPDNPTIRR